MAKKCGATTVLMPDTELAQEVDCDLEPHTSFYPHEDSVTGATWPKIDGLESTGDANG